MLRRTLRICLWTFAAVIVAMAVLLSAARLLLPGMSEYRGQIEAVAVRIFNRPVSIGSVDAAWHGLTPVLKFRDLIIDDPRLPGGQLAIDKVEVAVNVAESLLQRKLLTAGITVIGTELKLDTDVRHSREKFSLAVVVDWLLAQDSVMLKDVQLHWRDPGLFDAPVRLGGLSAKLVNNGQRHQFAVEAQLPMSQGSSLKVAADLYGKPGDYADWRGTLYLRSEDAQLSEFQPAMANSGLQAGGAFNLELWLGLADARAVWGSGNLAWHKPAVHNVSADGQGVSADNLSARFQWHRHDQRWRIGVSDFQLERDGRSVWPASRFDLVVAQEDKLRIRGKASVVVLEELTAVLPLLPWVDDNALAMLDRLQPRGLMHDAEFSFRYHAGTRPEFAMRSAIENLSLAANGGLPGVTGISGRVEGNLQEGNLQLDTSSAELRIPGVFPRPLALTGIDGDVHWQRFRDRFRIETSRLRVASGPLTLESRWLMDWPYEKGSPWLDLQLAADPLPLTAVSGYLPAGIMSAHAVEWLRQAFRDGTASNIRMLLQGRLDQMPFDEGQGRFEARFDFADANLYYHEGWGPLDELGGQAVFIGRTMQISAQSARLKDAPVERAVATIEDMQKPVLNVDGTVDSTLASMLDFVRHSPLQEEFGKLIDATETSGDARLQLHLGIPLKHDLGPVRVQGNVLLDGNELLPRQSEIGLSDIRGRLYFTRSDVSLKNAKARVLGRPVALSVYKQGKGDDAATVVNVQGRLKLVERARQQFPALAGWLHGDTGWQALLQIRDHEQAGQPRVTMDLHSGLQGVTISLPAPLAKAAAEARSVTVKWAPGEETVEPVQVRYGDLVKVNLLLTRDRHLRKAALHFGDDMAALPPRDEVRVSGHLDVIDAGEWLPVLQALDSGAASGTLASSIDLKTDVFRLGGVEVHNVSAASKSTDQWYFQLQGEDASGWIRWVRAARILPPQLLARLDQLHLHSRDKTDWSLPGGLQPASLPELGVEVRDLQWNERDFGQIAVVSRRTGEGVHFETLKLQSPAISLEGTGDWLVRNGVQASQLHADITGGSLERLSRMLGSGGVKGGSLKGRVALSWPGSPVDFSLSRMEGEFDVVSRDGRLENVDEGGAGKLLSLLSLNSLQRRLSLDFSDVVKEGLSYDVMKGHFVVMDGDAYTNDFTLEGTSVNIEVSGRTGLVKHDYDQLIKVTPQVTSTLPIAGAIAGGPLVGAAVFLADKLLGDRFNRLTQVQYQVSGSWEKPVYTKLNKEKPRRAPADFDDEY
jgi:uncharacterized protein (TIGR02099 family)